MNIELVVVNRHIEVERLIRTAELNHARGSDGEPLLDKPRLLYMVLASVRLWKDDLWEKSYPSPSCTIRHR